MSVSATGDNSELQFKMLQGVATYLPSTGSSGELHSETLEKEVVLIFANGGKAFPPLTGSPPHSNTASLPQPGDRGFPSAAAAATAAAATAAAGRAQPRPLPAAAMQFMLLFSRQRKLRLQKWYVPLSDKEKKKITRELVQTVLARKPKMCTFLEWRDLKIVYKRYASLYFCCAIEGQDLELITLEIIHRYVELLDKYFGSVCELDIIFNFEKAYFILDEFLLGGEVQETSKKNVLKAIEQADLQEEAETPCSVLEEIGLT
ncbi:AP-1 complex subunit sigma-2-like [Neovison vison]|uniref:AP-1 complex subunit sigma-2-like n=1 Tax=Neovison vison TaxID=452646 RepID=UPI001CEFCCAB|nr:AP-1 complex subunit sigma-2-like [Neogale vison]